MADRPCPSCDGAGTVILYGVFEPQAQRCGACGGSGEVPVYATDGKPMCPLCGNTGTVPGVGIPCAEPGCEAYRAETVFRCRQMDEAIEQLFEGGKP